MENISWSQGKWKQREKFIILMEQATNNDIFFLCGIDERLGQLVRWKLSWKVNFLRRILWICSWSRLSCLLGSATDSNEQSPCNSLIIHPCATLLISEVTGICGKFCINSLLLVPLNFPLAVNTGKEKVCEKYLGVASAKVEKELCFFYSLSSVSQTQ